MSKSFLRAVHADIIPRKKEYKLLILNENGVLNTNIEKADTVICPTRVYADTPLSCNSIITCGMSADSTLSFSCIDGHRALLSLSREVNGYRPGEVYVNFRTEMSVYENLALQAVRIINTR